MNRRWWELPNLFDLVGGPLLDKRLLAEGVRAGSMRRWAVAALLIRLLALPVPASWPEVTLWALAVLGLDLQGAVTAAPREAMRAIGQAVGAARGAAVSGYQWGRSAWDAAPADEPTPPEAS